MGLLGNAVSLIWCELPASMRMDQGIWHSQEHIPERLSQPGFLRARRGLADTTETAVTFMMFELENIQAMTSPEYLKNLNNPTPLSTKMNQSALSFNRSPSTTIASWAHGIGGFLLTFRYEPRAGMDAALRAWSEARVEELRGNDKVIGAHFFLGDPSASVPTKEQELRGMPDAAAGCVMVIEAFDSSLLEEIRAEFLDTAQFVAAGAEPMIEMGAFRLVHVAAKE
jgi:hypothetical protein